MNTIAPGWAVVAGDRSDPPSLEKLGKHIIVWGDTKLKSEDDGSESRPLPGTRACPEAYLAQVVQYCIDMDIPFGFVLTNFELVVFQVSRHEPGGGREPIVTRSSHRGPSAWLLLPSDATKESEFSSPLKRMTRDWVDFEDGDGAVPFVSKGHLPASPGPGEAAALPRALPQPAQTQTQTQRYTTPEIPSSFQLSLLSLDSFPPPSSGGDGEVAPSNVEPSLSRRRLRRSTRRCRN